MNPVVRSMTAPATAAGRYMSADTLAAIDVFRGLADEDRAALAVRCRVRSYRCGASVPGNENNLRKVYFIVSGQIRLLAYAASGQQVILRNLGAGQMFGELSAIDGKPYSVFAIARDHCQVASMSSAHFLNAMQHYPTVRHSTLIYLAATARRLTQRVFERDVLPVGQRLRIELFRRARIDEEQTQTAVVSPAPTHGELASYIGTCREMVSREMSALVTAGLIIRQGSDLVIGDVDRLGQTVADPTLG